MVASYVFESCFVLKSGNDRIHYISGVFKFYAEFKVIGLILIGLI